MPPIDTGFQVISEQRAILRRALAYKRQWEREKQDSILTKDDTRSQHECISSSSGLSSGLTREQLERFNDSVRDQSRGGGGNGGTNSTTVGSVHTQRSSSNWLPPIPPAGGAMHPRRTSSERMPHSQRSVAGLDDVTSVCGSQLSHRAVSSVCRDASDVSRFSERMRALEEKLEREEAMRVRMAQELHDVKTLLAAEKAGRTRKVVPRAGRRIHK